MSYFPSISGVVLVNQGSPTAITSGWPVINTNPVTTVGISGVVPNLTISGSVFINNINQVVSGVVQITGVPSVLVNNFPTNQNVTITNPAIAVSGIELTNATIVSSIPIPISGTSTISGVVQLLGTSSVNIVNFPTNQSVSGIVQVSNFPNNQNVTILNPTNTIAITGVVPNLTISGVVNVGNLPANQSVSGVVQLLGTSNVNVTNTINANISQPISVQGAVTLSGTPSVSVSNFPGNQSISGTVQIIGLVNTTDASNTNVAAGSAPTKAELQAVQYNLPLPSLSPGQTVASQADANGRLLINGAVAISGIPSFNETQINGIAIDTNTGLATAGTQRVVIASNQTPIFATGLPYTSAALTPGNFAVSTSSVQIAAANTNRKGIIVQNVSTGFQAISLGFGIAAVSGAGITLYAQGWFEMDTMTYTNSAINAIANVVSTNTASGMISVQEFD